MTGGPGVGRRVPCVRCGSEHPELPTAMHVPAPAAWTPEMSSDDSSEPGYARSTVNLKTMVHARAVGLRPWLELEPTDHPLAVEQRTGISWETYVRRVSPGT